MKNISKQIIIDKAKELQKELKELQNEILNLKKIVRQAREEVEKRNEKKVITH